MAKTPMQIRREAALAEVAVANRAENDHGKAPTGEEAQLLAALADDVRTLKAIASTERKEEAKKEILGKYEAFIDATLAADKGFESDIIAFNLVWNFDAKNFARALAIGKHSIKHGLSLPKDFKRKTAAFVLESMTAAAARDLNATVEEGFTLDLLAEAMNITEATDIHDEIKANAHKMYGMHLAKPEEASKQTLQEALRNLQRAESLNKNVGAKKAREKIESRLKKMPDQENDPTADQNNDQTNGNDPV